MKTIKARITFVNGKTMDLTDTNGHQTFRSFANDFFSKQMICFGNALFNTETICVMEELL